MKIEWTEQEADVAIKLFDVATKAGGLQVAQAAVALTAKLQQAFKKEEEAQE